MRIPKSVGLISIFLTQIVYAQRLQSTPQLTTAYIDSTDIIAIVEVCKFQEIPKYLCVQPKKVFKGHINEDTYLSINDSTIRLSEGIDYLIYASHYPDRPHFLILDSTSRALQLSEAQSDVLMLIATLNCYGPKPEGVACHRKITKSVCGCDGIVYGSPCEANIRGIYIYSIHFTRTGNNTCSGKY